MKLLRKLTGPFIVGALALVMQIVDQVLAADSIVKELLPGGGGWIAFQAWAVYFFSGSKLEGGIKALISYILGIIALLVIVTIANCNGYFKWIDNVPALFIGAGAYFCIMSYIAPTAATPYTGDYVSFALVELFYCVFGLVFGWITIGLQGICDKAFAKKMDAAA